MNKKRTIGQFINVCWSLMTKARKQGATVRDLYAIAQEAGAPTCTFNTFSTAFFQVGRSRRVLSGRTG